MGMGEGEEEREAIGEISSVDMGEGICDWVSSTDEAAVGGAFQGSTSSWS